MLGDHPPHPSTHPRPPFPRSRAPHLSDRTSKHPRQSPAGPASARLRDRTSTFCQRGKWPEQRSSPSREALFEPVPPAMAAIDEVRSTRLAIELPPD
nr:hypothetical protein CFP56_65510 [Quercus suber]